MLLYSILLLITYIAFLFYSVFTLNFVKTIDDVYYNFLFKELLKYLNYLLHCIFTLLYLFCLPFHNLFISISNSIHFIDIKTQLLVNYSLLHL